MSGFTVPEATIDVRQIMPHMRHSLIFDTFERLSPGEGFLLVNDHDPRPLLYHFNVAHPGEFGWDYLEEGPDVWCIRISRAAI